MDEIKEENLKPNPEEKANVLSRILLCFIFPFLRLGYSKPLDLKDFSRVLDTDESSYLTEALEKEWNKELAKSKEKSRPPSLHNALFALFGKKYCMIGFLVVALEMAKVCQPIFMGFLIRYFRVCSTMSAGMAYLWAALFALCAVLVVVLQHPYFYRTMRIGMQIRVACSGLIYKKILKTSSSGLHQMEVGQIVNLLSNDVAKFDQVVIFLHYFWAAPVSLIAFAAISWYEMGPSCLAGFACLVLLVPIQSFVGRSMGKYRHEVAMLTDKRIGVMSELLTGIRVIKMYAWEQSFSQMVDDYRRRELSKIRIQSGMQGFLSGVAFVSGKITVLCAILVFVFTGNYITAEIAFVMAALFNITRVTVTMMLPFAVQFYAEYKITLGRIERFLMVNEKEMVHESTNNEDSSKAKNENLEDDDEEYEDNIVAEMVNFSCKWSLDDKINTLEDINLRIRQGDLVIIVGPVGSGKSTILQSFCGETKITSGRIFMNGKPVYVPQDSWIFSASIRQNVIFGHQIFEQSRYEKTIEACAMEKDIASFSHGDGTVVGDRGVSLSGGQRARLGLARAVYCDADIYLLDDPISAVDSAVGRLIFEKCILQKLGQSARILVTHQLQYLKYADLIVVMKEGKIAASGSFGHLMKLGDTFTSILTETQESYRKRSDSIKSTDSGHMLRNELRLSLKAVRESEDDVEMLNSVVSDLYHMSNDTNFNSRRKSIGNDELYLRVSEAMKSQSEIKEQVLSQIEAEESSGSVGWAVYFSYYRHMGNICTVLLLVLLFIFVQVLLNISDLWLNIWATNEENDRKYEVVSSAANYSTPPSTCLIQLEQAINGTSKFQLPSYESLYIYTAMTVVLAITSVIRSVSFKLMLAHSSFILHSRMFQAILNAPVLFFDRNPVGRVLNRFSKDTGTMDEQLAFSTMEFMQGVFTFIATVLMVGILNPWVFLATLPLLTLFIYIRYYYMQSGRIIKGLEGSAKSPVYTHVSATLNGLPSIRCFQAEKYMIKDFHRHQNLHTTVFATYLSTSRLFSLVIDFLCSIFVACVAFISVASSAGQSAGNVGMSLFYAITMLGFFQWITHMSTEMETMMVSVDRIIQYSKLQPEEGAKKSSADVVPPKEWPQRGEIEFNDVKLKYSEDSNYVLKGLNFIIKSTEKIGIVGRTGAGKSSLLNALFRLSKLEGHLVIDHIDTKTISLKNLRKNISIIPQDPVIFIGSLRMNLDPFNEYTDDYIWQALDQVELKQTFEAYGDGLEALMQEGGSNLSVGQRQLVCLARALLKKNKILVIDEATANVDLHTDKLIQKTIRQQFKSCTVLTIAHRLNTIIDSSRVMVMDSGQLIEMDHAANLLRNEDTSFYKLVAETGPQNAKLLKTLAENSQRELEQHD